MATVSRLAVPASFFGSVLGLAGLGNDWRVAAAIWDLPAAIGEVIVAIAFTVWAVLLVLYTAKWIRDRERALAEVDDLIQGCFVALVPVGGR